MIFVHEVKTQFVNNLLAHINSECNAGFNKWLNDTVSCDLIDYISKQIDSAAAKQRLLCDLLYVPFLNVNV